MQDFSDGTQSSHIGPHLVQPLRTSPNATTVKISANRLIIVQVPPSNLSLDSDSDVFKPCRPWPICTNDTLE